MPEINGVAYSSKYEDTINGDGTTTRTLLIYEPITQISFCYSTNSGHLLSFDESYGVKLTTCANMFDGCFGLTSINVSNFDTSKVTDMSYMFYDCEGLTSLDIRSFSSIKLSSCSYMLDSVDSTCKVYVNKNKFTKTTSQCNFSGTFTYV